MSDDSKLTKRQVMEMYLEIGNNLETVNKAVSKIGNKLTEESEIWPLLLMIFESNYEAIAGIGLLKEDMMK